MPFIKPGATVLLLCMTAATGCKQKLESQPPTITNSLASAETAMAARKDCFDYDRQISLTGTVILDTFAGPPNYSSIEEGDDTIMISILSLPRPICTNANGREEDPNNLAEDSITRIQISAGRPIFKICGGKTVKVTGTLFHSYTAHHFTPTVLMVDSDGEDLKIESNN